MRYLHEFFKTELSQCQRYDTPLSLILLEPDQQKELLRAHGQKGID